jgi:hypothetical protein
MKISKSLDIDLNIISPQKHIRIHEGDVDSVDILIGVSVDDESVDLDGLTIKYDATINNYLVEQDADGSVVDGKISIPVTQNMTAMSGLLLVDVRMIRNDQILHTQTICATVEKAVVNGSTYIDFDKVTIIQRMNALEKQMEHVEEIIENFDTSKLIVSTNRPPMSVPSEVDVDLLRVGDTWIQRGANIVYKLTEAQYNYQDDPFIEPYHKFTWQPLNERYVSGNAEPPTTATSDRVSYDIETWHFSGLPVPEYFKGDQYSQMVDSDSEKHFTLNSVQMSQMSFHTVVYHYDWREEGGAGDASNKMDLAPLNPTYEQIAQMPFGQLYSDTANHKAVIKGGREFYDTDYTDNALREKQKRIFFERPKGLWPNESTPSTHEDGSEYEVGDLFFYGGILFEFTGTRNIINFGKINMYTRVGSKYFVGTGSPNRYIPPSQESATYTNTYYIGDELHVFTSSASNEFGVVRRIFRCMSVSLQGASSNHYYSYTWKEVPIETYSKAEIDSKIGDIGTALDTLNNNLAEV